MAKQSFTDAQIRTGLIEISDAAVARCSRDFHELRKTGKKQGLEKIFQTAFMKETTHPGWEVLPWVNRKSLANRDRYRPSGWIDSIIRHVEGHRIGVEFKVMEFPRLKNTSPWVTLYDVGQLAWDYASLKIYDLESAYCIVVLHGALTSMPGATHKGIARMFHNAMYVDFQASKHWGEFKYKTLNGQQKRQMKTMEDAGFDRPYFSGNVNRNSFCRHYRQHDLAVVGVSIK